ncbi:Ferritin-2 heavy chain [Schistosoma japonicum]|uniref:Ferritin n=1 Tax=Schistosoma japonicum TaxID=6182 RepID=A0A4Z2DD40_SCHJA|nr:Ferritin-2 heavy chain [Schistosoma japonicum]
MTFFTYFDQGDVSFPKAAEFFRKASHEEREHAEKLAKYQNKRGGCVRYILCDFIQCEYLQVQKDTIKQFADYLTKTITVGNRLVHCNLSLK